ncbi:hypothetical protein [Actinoplanes sp. L3-i22]|uniref:hypothetical protein n=1 Tax=Actinoplanes sp. L3-i22 TaxID=2836373 RepID=UPI001C786B25|nr:hypothetical protein [Actinoplanes sp. L3-i22]BCY12144.1 hypothetical protein L3i22_072320 [Actinoplanes sp. L3-i22]
MKVIVAVIAAAVLLGGCTAGSGHPASVAAPAPSASVAPVTNGIADLPAADILKRARVTLTAAKSFRIRGGLIASSDGVRPLLWMMDIQLAGDDAAGWTAMGSTKQDTLTVRGGHYLRPTAPFISSELGPDDGRKFTTAQAGRWISIPPRHEMFGDFVTRKWALSLLGPTGPVTKGAIKNFSGVPAIAVTYGGKAKTVVYVSTTGVPCPIHLDRTDLEGVSFSEFGAAPAIQPPAPADVVDLAAVVKGL